MLVELGVRKEKVFIYIIYKEIVFSDASTANVVKYIRKITHGIANGDKNYYL